MRYFFALVPFLLISVVLNYLTIKKIKILESEKKNIKTELIQNTSLMYQYKDSLYNCRSSDIEVTLNYFNTKKIKDSKW